MQLKNQNYYLKNDNLWNEPQRLHPKKFAPYSEKNIDPSTTFKKSVTDLNKIKENEIHDKFEETMKKIKKAKEEDKKRNLDRRLERECL